MMKKRIYVSLVALIALWTTESLLTRGWASGISASAYNLVENALTPVTVRTTLNCGSGVSCADDPTNKVTTITATGSGGSVTSVATGCFLTGGVITTTGTLSSNYGIDTQSGASYAIVTGDCGSVIQLTNTGAVAVSLPQAGTAGFLKGWWTAVVCSSTASSGCTITPATSTINGAATLVLQNSGGVFIVSDGTNYSALRTPPTSSIANFISSRGLFSGRPTCGPALFQFMYFSTDTLQESQCNGTSFADFYFSSLNQQIRPIGGSFNGGGSALASGLTTYVTVPFGCAIAAYNITADTGTVSFDVWKIATGTAIPTVANSILTGGFLALSSGTALHSASTALFTTTTVTANDIFGINLEAVSGATQVSLVMQCGAN